MTSTDVCKILEACSSSGVHRIDLGCFKVVFGNRLDDLTSTVTADYFDSLETTQEMNDNVQIDSKDINIQELAYSDPERYERIMQGDIDA